MNITSTVNKHMTHAEDLAVFGEDGLKWVITAFKQLYSNDIKDLNISIKFDGSPAVFAWTKFSDLPKAGIAIKSFFAKDPKLLYSLDDINRYYSHDPELVVKLKYMLSYIPSLNIPKGEIWQGDFLFDKEKIKEDDTYYSFHPNTILYKIRKESELGKKMKIAKLGLIWHTRYTGDSIKNVSAKYDVSISELTNTDDVFLIDPYIKFPILDISFEESEKVKTLISDIKHKIKKIDSTSYNMLTNDSEFVKLFISFENSLIKNRRHLESTNAMNVLKYFNKFIIEKYKNEEQKLVTQKAKNSIQIKSNETLNKTKNIALLDIIEIMKNITILKHMFIKKIKINSFETFLQTVDNKLIHTENEGFAISDKNGNAIKLINRHNFSFANFSNNIKKGWS